jgi:RecB family endonuclease NucS
MDTEDALEDYIFRDITILNDGWLIIGRQVATDSGKFMDLLAIDETGSLIVIELKKDQTPRGGCCPGH